MKFLQKNKTTAAISALVLSMTYASVQADTIMGISDTLNGSYTDDDYYYLSGVYGYSYESNLYLTVEDAMDADGYCSNRAVAKISPVVQDGTAYGNTYDGSRDMIEIGDRINGERDPNERVRIYGVGGNSCDLRFTTSDLSSEVNGYYKVDVLQPTDSNPYNTPITKYALFRTFEPTFVYHDPDVFTLYTTSLNIGLGSTTDIRSCTLEIKDGDNPGEAILTEELYTYGYDDSYTCYGYLGFRDILLENMSLSRLKIEVTVESMSGEIENHYAEIAL